LRSTNPRTARPRRGIAFAALALCGPSILAGGLSDDLKKWPVSPEAYFLTSAERAEWKKASTDEQAKELVARYWADRAPELKQTIQERVEVADKYFSKGKTRGSETLRGKVIILFGPPSEVKMKESDSRMGNASEADRAAVTSGVADPHSNVGPGARGLSRSEQDPVFTIAYDAAHAPKAIGKAFQVDVKMRAKEVAADPDDLDAKFEAVAKASRVRAASPVPGS